MSGSNEFLLKNLTESLKNASVSNDDVDLVLYNASYAELIKLLNQMGRMFYFVSSDVQEKVDILRKLHDKHKEEGENNPYNSVNKMLSFEKSSGLLESKSPKFDANNGSRTLLRLHRALLFLYELIQRLADENDSASMANLATAAYQNTLARFHSWPVRKAVGVATYALPHKDTFLNNIVKQQNSSELNTVDACRQLFKNESLPSMKIIYDRIEASYTREDLHKLP